MAATNRDLNAEVRAGASAKASITAFNVVSLRVPPLRDHAEDIPVLSRYFRAAPPLPPPRLRYFTGG